MLSKKIARMLWFGLAVMCIVAPVWAQDDQPEFPDEQVVGGDESATTASGGSASTAAPIVQPESAPAPSEAAPAEEEPVVEDQEGVYEEPAPQPILPAVRPSRATPTPRMSPPPARRPALPVRPSRTSTPARPPAGAVNNAPVVPNDEKTGDTPEAPISFDFNEVPLYDVIRKISALTGRNFDIDPNIGNTTVTVITHDRIPPEMAFAVLESILATRGFSMVETLEGNLIKVIATPDASTSDKVPLRKGGGDIPKGYDTYSTHVVSVKYADASELASALQILGSRNARIDTYAPSNTLIITDTADGLRRMFSFLSEADVPGFDTTMEIFTLEYTRAEVLAQQLEQVLLDSGGGARAAQAAARPQPTRPTRPPVRPVPGAVASQVIGSREEVLRMVSDERLNALIVMATDGMMERVRDLVKRLDMPTPYEANNLHIYELLNADAEQVETALQPLIGAAPRKAGGTGGAAAGGGSQAQSAEVQPFEQKVQIARYDQTNSLLIVASPQDYQLLEAFIARLDVPQRQVLVEAVVMDVTMRNNFVLSVDASALTGNDGFGMTYTGNIKGLAPDLTDATNLLNVAKAASTIVGGPGAALGLGTLMGLGSTGGVTAGVFDDYETEINGTPVKIPFVPLLFQAIETLSDLEVLSQPSLVTIDNEEASIVVGQEVPFITSQSRGLSTDNTINSNYGYTRVERHDVGIKLTVTPQISEGDYVALDLEIEVSEVAKTQEGGVDPNIAGPTTNKSQVKNRILVKDGSTVVIAGLIKDTKNRTRSQPPILGDIPLIGWIFGKRENEQRRQNMVVLVTPHIVKEGIDLDRITQYKVGEYHDANIDDLFDRGFFKKIKQKRQIRKKHHPTFDRSAAITGRSSGPQYGRGDIKR